MSGRRVAINDEIDRWLDKAAEHKQIADSTPWWRPLKRRRHTNLWLACVGVVQGIEQRRGRSVVRHG